ncbi:MAG: YfhO family protein [Oscillospiraceae bacterium]|nr:YfhO family protein [Oscillospiraceae bacterium]
MSIALCNKFFNAFKGVITIKKLTETFKNETREKYFLLFITAFLLSAAAFLPFIIAGDGRFIFYGDYDAQQIPFYYHVHSAIRQGCFGWDFTTDLGTDLFGSYTFYLLGSPFFWLTVPFPDSAVPYLMPWLICLKTAVAAVTAYALLRGFTSNRNACFLGGLLYAFSGFQLYNLMFNHFHDPTAFFPLLLLMSDKFMRENKRGAFALVVALCAVTNYFFFAGMAVFTVIWFSVNVLVGRYKFTFGKFLLYAFEAILGVVIAAVILLPSAAALMGNERAGNFMTVGDAFIYKDKFIYIYIIKSFFTFPDLPLESMFTVSEDLECASAACFLPFVSASGVIAYILMQKKRKALRKDVLVITLLLSVIFMFVPCLGGLFTMLNAQYYARWFFAPVLIMCIMTAVAAGDDIALFKKASVPCIAAAVIFTAGAVIYIIVSGKGNLTGALISGVIPLGCLGLLWSCLSDSSLNDNSSKLIAVIKRTALCCTVFTAFVIAQGKMTVDRMTQRDYINTALNSRQAVDSLKASDSGYFRVDMCENYINRNLMWGLGSCSSFISTVNSSVSEVQNALGYPRQVTSRIPYDHAAFRSLTSVKYYFDSPMYDEDGKRDPFPILGNAVETFDYVGEVSDMLLYENKCFIPMGFTYDHYISPEDLQAVEARIFRSQALLEAVALTVEQQEKFADILQPYDLARFAQCAQCAQCEYDCSRLVRIAEEKRRTACRDFYTDRKGFGATFENSENKDKLVFFSVPYDDGWSAEINGEPARIEKVSYGFMALRCKPGISEVRFNYTSKPLAAGAAVSLAGLAILVVYMIACKRQSCKKAE